MEKAIRVSVVMSALWSLVVWGVFSLFTLLWVGLSPMAGSILSSRKLSSGEFLLLVACLVGSEALLLLALWGAYRLRPWACLLLSVGLLAVSLLEYRVNGSCTLTMMWLAPCFVTAILLWCAWFPWKPR